MPPAPASRSIVIGRIGPIEIAIHPSWLITFVVLTVFAHMELVSPSGRPGLVEPGSAWAAPLSIGVALLFFSFILLHEVSHALVARAHGLDARRVTLFVFGGVAQIGAEAERPAHEFRIAVAGPLTSLLLAGLLAAVSRSLHPGEPYLQGLWGELAVLNLALALFNLVPAFPMDGGRILRAGLWQGLRDRARATRWAASLGKAFAFALIGAGAAFAVTSLAVGETEGLTGLWWIVLGFFLFNVAGAAGRAEGGAEPRRAPYSQPVPTDRPAAIVGDDEGQAPQPDAGGRRGRAHQRPDAAPEAGDQSGDRPRDPRSGSAHPRGTPQRHR
jgi:Zn-dependent protease